MPRRSRPEDSVHDLGSAEIGCFPRERVHPGTERDPHRKPAQPERTPARRTVFWGAKMIRGGVCSRREDPLQLLTVLLLLGWIGVSFGGCARLTGVGFESDASREVRAEETREAIAALRRMSDFLGASSTLRFEAEVHYDAVQASGEKVEFGSHRRLALRRPDGARVDVTHREGGRELITFDGERLSAAAPENRAYASVDLSGTASEALAYLVNEHGFISPLSDLVRVDLADVIEERAMTGRHIGIAVIEGIRSEHLVFRGETIDFQIFIALGEAPIPLRFLIDYHEAEGRPQFRAALRNWELEPELPTNTFRFVPPVGAQRVSFDELLDLILGPPEPEGGDR